MTQVCWVYGTSLIDTISGFQTDDMTDIESTPYSPLSEYMTDENMSGFSTPIRSRTSSYCKKDSLVSNGELTPRTANAFDELKRFESINTNTDDEFYDTSNHMDIDMAHLSLQSQVIPEKKPVVYEILNIQEWFENLIKYTKSILRF